MSTALSATLAQLHRLLASAAQESLPSPLSATVSTQYRIVYMHLGGREDLEWWHQWLILRDADGQWTWSEKADEHGRHTVAAAEWRGWQIQLGYTTRTETLAGVGGGVL